SHTSSSNEVEASCEDEATSAGRRMGRIDRLCWRNRDTVDHDCLTNRALLRRAPVARRHQFAPPWSKSSRYSARPETAQSTLQQPLSRWGCEQKRRALE